MSLRRGNTRTAPSASDYADTAVAVADREDDDDLYAAEDEDERPARSSMIQRGWAAATKMAEETRKGDFVDEFKFSEEDNLIAFLEDDPFAVYAQHWLDGRKGKKSFVCPASIDAGPCPLCDRLADSPSAKFAFSVVNLGDDDAPVEMLIAGPRLLNVLAKWNEDEKTGPLSKGYYAVSRTGKGSKTSYSVRPIKERDLAEDFDLDPDLVREAVKNATPLDSSAIYVTPTAELADIAREESRD